MSASHELVPMASSPGCIPIAQMRRVYRTDEVERRLGKLAPKEHETLRATYERML
jgi:ATP-dependent Lon protease